MPRLPRLKKAVQLSPEQQSLLKNLQKEQSRLEKEIKKLREYHNYGTADSENAQEIEEFSGQIGLRQKLQEGLTNTKLAMKKLESGRYGFCEDCKQPIAPARLKANPTAIYCVTCQTKAAKKISPKRRWFKLPWMKK